uniref:Cobalamin biosynthesis protein CbiA n=1 Tax=candidate division WOR-3 bacterium TaxID=2052148 RepID=A0A7V3PUG8_UNCW3
MSKISEPAAGARWFNASEFLSGLRRINLFAGGYGSGKSEIAVNFALSLAEEGRQVAIADLDIVNPYFRSREARAVLEARNIRVLMPPVTMMETDLPMLGPEIKGALVNEDGYLVLDLGGDPVGAKVMASLRNGINSDNYCGFFVLNSRRPFSSTVDEVRGMIRGIEGAAGLPITELVVNSHLIDETSAEVIKEGIKLAEGVSQVTNKPVGFVVVERRMLKEVAPENIPYPVLILDRQLLKPWERAELLGPKRFKI